MLSSQLILNTNDDDKVPEKTMFCAGNNSIQSAPSLFNTSTKTPIIVSEFDLISTTLACKLNDITLVHQKEQQDSLLTNTNHCDSTMTKSKNSSYLPSTFTIDENEHVNSSDTSMRKFVEIKPQIKSISQQQLNNNGMIFLEKCLGHNFNSNENHGRMSQESNRETSRRYSRRRKQNISRFRDNILEFMTKTLTPFAYWSMGKCPPLCNGNVKVDHMSTNSTRQEEEKEETNNNSNLVCTVNVERLFNDDAKHNNNDDDDYIYTPVGSIMTNNISKARITSEYQNDVPLPFTPFSIRWKVF